ncbi:MAG: NAD(P)/FAD-dependent oxidoreductase, partial [Clostridia bacterium]|nr:NAD(P)/FAD-dependent oxidoreductase [Clostridia bacterium]
MFDVAIVGGGPAGIQAALNVKIRALSMVMFSGPGGLNKVKSAKEIPNVLGFPNIKGETLAGAYEEHMRLAGILPILKPIDHIYPMGDYYVLTSGDEMSCLPVWRRNSAVSAKNTAMTPVTCLCRRPDTASRPPERAV